MSSRLNFRPRPLELSKQLPIVRDRHELDPPAEGGKDVMQTIEAREEAKRNPKLKTDIPIPLVRDVPTYGRDYLPIFKRLNTYIRGRGGVGHRDETFVEYDMDEADTAWLEQFNRGQDRLPPRRFELLIWRLELVNAEANDRVSAAQGTGVPDRMSPGVVAQIGNMTKAEALAALSHTRALRPSVLAAVYAYWREKRIKRGKPLLRRLQAPTAPSDSNPFNVFRPRDKIHRPQTRRRRENSEESAEKMRLLRANLVRAYEVLEWVTRREQRKCHLAYMDTDLQQLQLRLHHSERPQHAVISAEYAAQARAKPPRRPLHLHYADAPGVDVSAADASDLSRFKRRKKGDRRDAAPPISQLPPPPLPPEPDMPWAEQPDVTQLLACLATGEGGAQQQGQEQPPQLPRGRPRIGRGGRLIFDRCKPFSYEPLDEGPADGQPGAAQQQQQQAGLLGAAAANGVAASH